MIKKQQEITSSLNSTQNPPINRTHILILKACVKHHSFNTMLSQTFQLVVEAQM